METSASPLDNLRVASPCTANWDTMKGSDSARFCGECRKNVYNLSAMTRAEAETLIAGAEGRLCVRYYRRADGTVMTEDCPVGVRTVRQRIARWARAVSAAALALVAAGAASNTASAGGGTRMGRVAPHRTDTTTRKVDTVARQPDTVEPEHTFIMGDMAAPEPEPTLIMGDTVNAVVDGPVSRTAIDSAVMVPVQITIPVITAEPVKPATTTAPVAEPAVTSVPPIEPAVTTAPIAEPAVQHTSRIQ